MKNLITLSACLLLLLIPTVVFGASGEGEHDYNALLQFLKGDGAFEKWFMKAFTQLDTTIAAQSAATVMMGKSIGGFGAMCYMGYLGWQMQEGARPWEVTPMIRPTIIALILTYWVSFTYMIRAPFEAMAQPGIAIFENIEKDANNLRVKRFQKQSEILEVLIKAKSDETAKAKQLEKLEDKSEDKWFDIDADKLLQPVEEWFMKMNFEFQKLCADIIEALALTILRVCTYLIFFIQKIWTYVLIILGPIAVGMSLIPGFENSINNWVAKFINVNLYTFITYTIINIGQQIIMAGYTMELERYDLLISEGGTPDMAMLLLFVSSNGFIYMTLFTAVAYLITGIGILMVPSIADSIVSAGGTGIMSKVKSAGGAVMSAGKAVASGGKSIAVSAAKSAAAGSPSGRVAGAMKNGSK
jgi:hypothetical protein